MPYHILITFHGFGCCLFLIKIYIYIIYIYIYVRSHFGSSRAIAVPWWAFALPGWIALAPMVAALPPVVMPSFRA